MADALNVWDDTTILDTPASDRRDIASTEALFREMSRMGSLAPMVKINR